MRYHLLLLVLVVGGCASVDTLSEDDLFRIDMLYGHSLMMVEFSTPHELARVSMNGSALSDSPLLTPQQKLQELQASFGITVSEYPVTKQITLLEDHMHSMMLDWEFDDDIE